MELATQSKLHQTSDPTWISSQNSKVKGPSTGALLYSLKLNSSNCCIRYLTWCCTGSQPTPSELNFYEKCVCLAEADTTCWAFETIVVPKCRIYSSTISRGNIWATVFKMLLSLIFGLGLIVPGSVLLSMATYYDDDNGDDNAGIIGFSFMTIFGGVFLFSFLYWLYKLIVYWNQYIVKISFAAPNDRNSRHEIVVITSKQPDKHFIVQYVASVENIADTV